VPRHLVTVTQTSDWLWIGFAESGPTACPSAAASARQNVCQKTNDLAREAVGCMGMLARYAQGFYRIGEQQTVDTEEYNNATFSPCL
jgi:hypothetical protein